MMKKSPGGANNSDIKHLDDRDIQKLFAPIQDMYTPDQDIQPLLTKVIQYTYSLVKKVKLDNEYIDKHMGRLSTREILATGMTCYMNSCLDFVLVTIQALKKVGISDIRLVIDELESPCGPHKIHFGIELMQKGIPHYIDYKMRNDVVIGQGNFESNYQEKGERVVNKTKIDAKHISIDDTMYTLIDKGLVQFRFFDINILDAVKQKLKHDNTDAQRTQGFVNQVQDIHQPAITTKDKISSSHIHRGFTLAEILDLAPRPSRLRRKQETPIDADPRDPREAKIQAEIREVFGEAGDFVLF